MKKILYSLVALAAIAACSKSEVQYDDQQVEIGFAPVAQNVTKSVAGLPTDGGYNNAFPTDLNLYIFANAQADDLTNSWPAAYLRNAKFIYNREGTSNEVYEGEQAYYWPNVKSLIFAGYSSPSASALTASISNDMKTLTVEGYVQDNSKGYTKNEDAITVKPGANELMWFPWNEESSYTKRNTAVPVTMQHACSWITIKVARDVNTTNETWKLNSLKINDLYHTGNATCTKNAATWALTGSTAAETLFTSSVEGGTNLSTTATEFENVANNMVVLPQTPTTIDVEYSFVSQSGLTPITETYRNLSLAVGVGDANKWLSGKHYIYTITITATEILIDPEVKAWDPVTVPSTTI